jgi:predicted AlkP superfamily pyrophosphatase or phosphodiesterase
MLRRLALVLVALGVTGCPVEPEPEPEPELPRKVLIVGVDGLRGDGIPGADTPAIDALFADGAVTYEASTHLRAPTVSGPGWSSMLTGVDADKHLIYGNGGWDQFERFYPTVLARTHDLGFATAAGIHWAPIETEIIEDGAIDLSTSMEDDEGLTDGMVEALRDDDFDVHFVAWDELDAAGHGYGYSTEVPEYVATIERLDGYLGRLVEAVEARPTRDAEEWLFVLTADHGGDGTGHGALNDDCRTIPLLVAGDGVVGGAIAEGASHMDVHPTVMHHLRHPPEDWWELDGEVRGLE